VRALISLDDLAAGGKPNGIVLLHLGDRPLQIFDAYARQLSCLPSIHSLAFSRAPAENPPVLFFAAYFFGQMAPLRRCASSPAQPYRSIEFIDAAENGLPRSFMMPR
jgi:hypothetical protein